MAELCNIGYVGTFYWLGLGYRLTVVSVLSKNEIYFQMLLLLNLLDYSTILAPEGNLFCGSLQYIDFILMISLKVDQKFQAPLEKISGCTTGVNF